MLINTIKIYRSIASQNVGDRVVIALDGFHMRAQGTAFDAVVVHAIIDIVDANMGDAQRLPTFDLGAPIGRP